MTHQPVAASGLADSRRWPRYSLDLPVRVLLGRNSRDETMLGRGTALNEGGLAVDVDTKLQVGNCLQVEFVPPYCALPLRMRGTVRNARGNRYGVEFLAADAGEEQEIELFRQILRSAANQLPQT